MDLLPVKSCQTRVIPCVTHYGSNEMLIKRLIVMPKVVSSKDNCNQYSSDQVPVTYSLQNKTKQKINSEDHFVSPSFDCFEERKCHR